MFEDYPALASALTKHAQPDSGALPWYDALEQGRSPIQLPGASGPGLDQQLTDRTLGETWKLIKNNPVKSVAYGAGVPLAGYGLYKLLSGLGGKNPREEKEEAKIASDYPALTNAAKTAACGCGVCADCRAKAGSKDNMRVQDKNSKKVPVKDYEITGEAAWKGVPNVKTSTKKAALGIPPENWQKLLNNLTTAAPTALGAVVGGGINYARGKNPWRGAGTGALTAFGADAGGHLGSVLSSNTITSSPQAHHLRNLVALGGAGGGGIAGYQTAQSLFGDEEEKEKTAMLRKQAAPPAITEMKVGPDGTRVPRAPAPAGPSWMQQAGDAANNAWTGGKNLFGLEQAQGPGQAIRGGSAADYSSQAGQWLADQVGYGDQFKNLGAGWQAGLPALGGAAALGLGSYGLSRLFGGSDKDKEKTSAYIARNYPVKSAGNQSSNYVPPPQPSMLSKLTRRLSGALGTAGGVGALGLGVGAAGYGAYKGVQGLSHLFGGKEEEQEKEKTSAYIARNYPTKQAGYWSELASSLNPLNLVAGPFASAAALSTPTRNLRDQATSNIDDTWSNLLIPGKGPYNSAKRLGWSIRGPELEAARAAAEAKGSKEPEDDGPQHPGDPGFEEKLKQHMDDNNLKYSAARDLLVCANALTKQGGYWSEMLAGIPAEYATAGLGGTAGLIASGFSPTKNIKELGEQDTKSWSNMLPGVGFYRGMKRLGTSIRGPEMKAMEEQIRAERAAGNPDAAPSLGTFHGKEEDENYRKAYMSEDEESEKDVAKEKAAAARYLLSSASMLTR